MRTTNQTSHALQNAIAQIEKAFGKGSLLCLEQEAAEHVEVVSTGSLGLDLALGIGGLPVGRIVEIYGPESSGKTTLSMHVIAEAQKLGHTCAFIDVEHAFDSGYAIRLGIEPGALYISQPNTGEEALEIVDCLVRSGAIKVLVLDSVAALVPKAELEGDMGDSHMGLQARLMSQALRKLTSSISKSNTVVIFINQIRQKIGVVYGNPETTTGGNALKFYASVRLDIRRIGSIKGKEQLGSGKAKGEEQLRGNQVRVKVVKNKLAPPFREVVFDIMYGKGISKISELIEFGVRLDLIQKSGSWYAYQSEKLGQGKEAVETYLLKHPEKMAELEQKIRTAVNPKTDFFDWAPESKEEESGALTEQFSAKPSSKEEDDSELDVEKRDRIMVEDTFRELEVLGEVR
jgi:recombination protein RecA